MVKTLFLFFLLIIQNAYGQTNVNNKKSSIIYFNSFESGDFSIASFVQGLDTSQGPGGKFVFVTTYKDADVPALDGMFVAHFERPFYGSGKHAKLYKEWSKVGNNDSHGQKL